MKTVLDTLVTDRTQEDVDRAARMNEKGWARMTRAEQAEYLGGPKGAYTRHDLNRAAAAMAYLEFLMNRAGVSSAFRPVQIRHATINGTWTDTTWIDEDKPRPAQWAAHLANVEQYWDYVCRITAAVPPRYDSDKSGYIAADRIVTAGDVCAVKECCGLLELTADIACDPEAVSVSGTAWVVKRTETGYWAAYKYLEGPFPDVGDALKALSLSCGRRDDVTDLTISFTASLRRGAPAELGRCAVRWSPFVNWGEFEGLYGTWDGAGGLTWDGAQRGAADNG